jgi:hypothetical protein
VATPDARAEELFSRVIAPLVVGGALSPVRPIGARLAARFGTHRVVDTALLASVDATRLRVARQLLPVDELPELDAAEWALSAALNDLLQLTHHELTGALSRSRRARLAEALDASLASVPAATTLGQALARHATFSRVLELSRTDTEVSWWTGRAAFRGQPPPRRLVAWPSVRQVAITPTRVRLAGMAKDLRDLDPTRYDALLGALLAKTPLTDLATATRSAPAFAWSPATLGLIAAPMGRTLALRAVLRARASRAHVALRGAAEALSGPPEAVVAFLAELEQASRAA